MRLLLQEVKELGARRVVGRLAWEGRMRSRVDEFADFVRQGSNEPIDVSIGQTLRAAIADPTEVSQAVSPRLFDGAIEKLSATALDAVEGRVCCFGRWTADFGHEISWHKSPHDGTRWDASIHGTRILRNLQSTDVKLVWEVGRFPQAYAMARAAAFRPELSQKLSDSIAEQIRSFRVANQFGQGVHWASSQEIVFRIMAWLFAYRVMDGLGFPLNDKLIANAIYETALHTDRYIAYAKRCVYNNHLLSEAFGLLLGGILLPTAPQAEKWRSGALEILTREAAQQVADDGGYIQNSHNYHRLALQVYLLAHAFMGHDSPNQWRCAMERSLDFLVAHQNETDGCLPNYGANDGGMPAILSTCDFSDFRPTLQATSIASRGERIYPPGPWDEEAAWLLGPHMLDVPIRSLNRTSVSFATSGYHVLRGFDRGTFAAFRCGTVLDRFSQIDMLHLDVWWRGHNVLVDPGSYLYNGPAEWHNHFHRTASHNTATIDGHDQMFHHRKFKNLYWTEARLLRFEDKGTYALCEGEHYGYRRQPGQCVHRRSVFFFKDDLWIVVDTLTGIGEHAVRLHWLAGDFPYTRDSIGGSLNLHTPSGDFTINVLNMDGEPLQSSVVVGSEQPIRGWLSRYYGEKIPVPSFEVSVRREFPCRIVTVLAAVPASWSVVDGRWNVRSSGVEAELAIGDELRVIRPLAG
jgi:Heparinase II/III-like protein/Heparinase II/III N-terminus